MLAGFIRCLAYFFLNLAGILLNITGRFPGRVAGDLTGDFLHGALDLMLVPSVRFLSMVRAPVADGGHSVACGA